MDSAFRTPAESQRRFAHLEDFTDRFARFLFLHWQPLPRPVAGSAVGENPVEPCNFNSKEFSIIREAVSSADHSFLTGWHGVAPLGLIEGRMQIASNFNLGVRQDSSVCETHQ
jgi:hypothetical protein